MLINVSFDSSVNSAAAGFVAAVNYVVNFFQTHFTNPVTVNINVGYGEIDGQPLAQGALGESESFISNYSYSQIKGALAAGAISADQRSAAASLPTNDPTNGGTFWASTAEAKALGLMQASSAVDGFIGFSSTAPFTYDPNNRAVGGAYDFIGVVEHEISEVMGRMLFAGQTVAGAPNSFDPLDLFHFSSAGQRSFSGTQAGYFSPDNGSTNLDNFNTNPNGDSGDWAGSAGNDAFVAFSNSGVKNDVSQADIRELNVLGWDVPKAVTPLNFLQAGVAPVSAGTGVVGTGDFNSDGRADILFDNTGTVAVWEMNGFTAMANVTIQSGLPSAWQVVGTGDFNGDRMSDIVLQNTNGGIAIWEMNGTQLQAGAVINAPGWNVAGVGDFNGDGMSDLVLQNSAGRVAVWEMNGLAPYAGAIISGPTSLHVIGTGDFNGDHLADIVLQNTDGNVTIWDMNGTTIQASAVLGSMTSAWHLVGTGDFFGNGKCDILWQNDNHSVEIWQMNGLQLVAAQVIAPPAGGGQLQGHSSPSSTASAPVLIHTDDLTVVSGSESKSGTIPETDLHSLVRAADVRLGAGGMPPAGDSGGPSLQAMLDAHWLTGPSGVPNMGVSPIAPQNHDVF